MKKFISLLCMAAITFSMAVMPVSSAASSNEKFEVMAQTLKGLEIFDATSMTETRYIERGEFIGALSKFLYKNEMDPRTAAISSGMMTADDKFEEELYITLAEAAKYAVIALGYKSLTDEKGGSDEAYVSQAKMLGVFDGITSDAYNILLVDDGVRLLYNMIDINPRVRYYKSSGDYGYTTYKDETLLSLNRDIEIVKGVVNKTYVTGTDSVDGCPEEHIEIGGITYYSEYDYSKDLLGKYVSAYIERTSDGNETVLYVSPSTKKNREIIINADDIDSISEDFSSIRYYGGSSSSAKNAKISVTPSVIYNERFISNYTVNDFMPQIGNLRLLDNDSNGIYDLIFITSCKTMIVESIADNPVMIYDKISINGKKDVYEIDDSKVDYEIILDGVKVPVVAIGTNSVVNIAESKDKGFVMIYASSAVKTGDFSRINADEMSITVSGEEHGITPEFKEWYQSEVGTVTMGRKYNFYIDYFGNIAFMDYVVQASKYALMLKSYHDSDEECYSVKYMDTSGIWHLDKLEDNIRYNGTKYSDDAVYEEIKGFKPQIVVLEKNADDKISMLKTAVKYSKNNKIDDFSVLEGYYTWLPWVMGFGYKAYITTSTPIFVFPEVLSMEESDYQVRRVDKTNYFKEWKGYTIKAYDLDEYFNAAVLSINDADYIHEYVAQYQTFFVTDASISCSVDGEERKAVKGVLGTDTDAMFIAANDSVFANVKNGDLIRYTKDAFGYVDYVQIYGNIISSTESAYIVEGVDMSGMRLKYSLNGEEYAMFINPTVVPKFYDEKTGRCEVGKLSELRQGQRILISELDYRVTNIIAAE